MILAKLPKWKRLSSLGLGLLLCINSTIAYSQSEPSPSDAREGVVQSPSVQENDSTVPVPPPEEAEEPIEPRSDAPTRSTPVPLAVENDKDQAGS
ncbi:MAG: hypothetical protein KDA72_05230, partial [Planctomycetales bacterium]|nr:hypothetical protein [Planctomycetales bacterium]